MTLLSINGLMPKTINVETHNPGNFAITAEAVPNAYCGETMPAGSLILQPTGIQDLDYYIEQRRKHTAEWAKVETPKAKPTISFVWFRAKHQGCCIATIPWGTKVLPVDVRVEHEAAAR
jgi:hypothetical protein